MFSILFILASFFTGTLQGYVFFDPEKIDMRLQEYSEEEKQLLQKDLDTVRSVCFNKKARTCTSTYIATAGGPGSRKTTILEKFLENNPQYQNVVYLDPDARALKFMAHTYQARSMNALTIAKVKDFDEVIKEAYNKWRAGSNYITLTLLEEAFASRLNVAHGTTSTGQHVPELLETLKDNGYQIIMLLCLCPDEARYEAIDYRNNIQKFYQSSPEDALSKGLHFTQRMAGYFISADKLYLYWSDNLNSPEKLAAIWENKELRVLDEKAMQSFINKYEKDRSSFQENGATLPSFSSLLSLN